MASSRGAGRASSSPIDGIDGERPVRLALDEPPPRIAGPRQQVGVMLDHRRDDDVGRPQAEAVREVVDRLGRVAADDRDVVRPGAAGEREDRLAGVLVRGGHELRLVARAAMDARVPREEARPRVRGDGRAARSSTPPCRDSGTAARSRPGTGRRPRRRRGRPARDVRCAWASLRMVPLGACAGDRVRPKACLGGLRNVLIGRPAVENFRSAWAGTPSTSAASPALRASSSTLRSASAPLWSSRPTPSRWTTRRSASGWSARTRIRRSSSPGAVANQMTPRGCSGACRGRPRRRCRAAARATGGRPRRGRRPPPRLVRRGARARA